MNEGWGKSHKEEEGRGGHVHVMQYGLWLDLWREFCDGRAGLLSYCTRDTRV